VAARRAASRTGPCGCEATRRSRREPVPVTRVVLALDFRDLRNLGLPASCRHIDVPAGSSLPFPSLRLGAVGTPFTFQLRFHSSKAYHPPAPSGHPPRRGGKALLLYTTRSLCYAAARSRRASSLAALLVKRAARIEPSALASSRRPASTRKGSRRQAAGRNVVLEAGSEASASTSAEPFPPGRTPWRRETPRDSLDDGRRRDLCGARVERRDVASVGVLRVRERACGRRRSRPACNMGPASRRAASARQRRRRGALSRWIPARVGPDREEQDRSPQGRMRAPPADAWISINGYDARDLRLLGASSARTAQTRLLAHRGAHHQSSARRRELPLFKRRETTSSPMRGAIVQLVALRALLECTRVSRERALRCASDPLGDGIGPPCREGAPPSRPVVSHRKRKGVARRGASVEAPVAATKTRRSSRRRCRVLFRRRSVGFAFRSARDIIRCAGHRSDFAR